MKRLAVVLIVLNMTIVGLATMVLTVSTVPGSPSEPMATFHLSYKGRYEHQPEGPDHLLGVEMVNGELLVTGALGAYFLDWSLVNSSYLTHYITYFKPPFNFPTNQDDTPQSGNYHPKFYGSVTYDAGGGTKYIYINARYDGIYILNTTGTDLNYEGRIVQNRRFSEGLRIDGTYLYAAHHADGIEIYDLSANPARPTVVGNITAGFTDAWAVFPTGNTLYVADGRGGLKVVDISNKANPFITWSEDPTTSPGNMMDVVAVGGYVYGACGGQGIAVYKKNAFDERTVTMVNGAPQALALMAQGDIAVAGRSWIHIIRPDGAGGFDLLASERMIRRAGENGLMVRIASDILVEGNHIVSASWDQVDVYELMDDMSDNQPDVLFDKQMVNFGVDGRSESIKIENQGTAVLKFQQPQIISEGNFQATLSKGQVPPGDFAWLNITHDGQGTDTRAQITIQTNDPDENPIRFMAYGRTKYVDIGEPMPSFAMESGQGDFSGSIPEWTFTSFKMSDRVGERVPVLETPLPDLTMEEDNSVSGIDLLDVSGHFTSGSTGKVTFIAIVGSWCPACPPAVTSIGYDIYQRYQHRDDFGAYLMSQGEATGSMMHLMEKTKIPGYMIFDEAGNTAKTTLAQYDVNLPFGRSYIVDHKGIVRAVGKGYNPQGAWKILDEIFAEIDDATDLRYEVSYEEEPSILGASGGNGTLFSFVQNQANWTGKLSFKVRAVNSGEDWTSYNSDDMSLDSNLFTVTIAPSLTPEPHVDEENRVRARDLLARVDESRARLEDKIRELGGTDEIPETAYESYKRGKEELDRAMILFSDGNYVQAIRAAKEAMQHIREAYRILLGSDQEKPAIGSEEERNQRIRNQAEKVMSLGVSIERAYKYLEKLNLTLQNLIIEGYDVSRGEEELYKVQGYLDKAEEHHAEGLLNEANRQLKAASENLDRINEFLINMVQRHKEMKTQKFMVEVENKIRRLNSTISMLQARLEEGATNQVRATLSNVKDKIQGLKDRLAGSNLENSLNELNVAVKQIDECLSQLNDDEIVSQLRSMNTLQSRIQTLSASALRQLQNAINGSYNMEDIQWSQESVESSKNLLVEMKERLEKGDRDAIIEIQAMLKQYINEASGTVPLGFIRTMSQADRLLEEMKISFNEVQQNDINNIVSTFSQILRIWHNTMNVILDNLRGGGVQTQDQQWTIWSDAALEATSQAIDQWILNAYFDDIVINGSIAVGPPGCLKSPSLNSDIRLKMIENGVPNSISEKYAECIADAWSQWQSQIRVPGLLWYPGFEAFPGPHAPPTPNVPHPFIAVAFTSSNIVELTHPSILATRINNAFSTEAQSTDALQSFQQFAQRFTTRFSDWVQNVTITNVMGRGPVPHWGDLYPVGSVINGWVIPEPPHLESSQPF